MQIIKIKKFIKLLGDINKMRPGGSALLFNVKTIEGDEKKHALIVPRSHLFMPLIKLKKNVV